MKLLHFHQLLAAPQGGVGLRIAGRVAENPELETPAQAGVGLDFIDDIDPHLRRGQEPVDEDHGDAVGIVRVEHVEPGFPQVFLDLHEAHEALPKFVARGMQGDRCGEIGSQGNRPSAHAGGAALGGVAEGEDGVAPAKIERGGDGRDEAVLRLKRRAPPGARAGLLLNAHERPSVPGLGDGTPQVPAADFVRRGESGELVGRPHTVAGSGLKAQAVGDGVGGQRQRTTPEPAIIGRAEERRQFARRGIVDRLRFGLGGVRRGERGGIEVEGRARFRRQHTAPGLAQLRRRLRDRRSRAGRNRRTRTARREQQRGGREGQEPE